MSRSQPRAHHHWPRPILFSLLALSLLFAGCGKTTDELVQQAREAESAARLACEADEPKTARKAADRAESALETLEKRAAKAKDDKPALDAAAGTARLAARAARDHAQLATERAEFRDLCSSIKARAYRATRSTIFHQVLPQLANAAESADTAEPGSIQRRLAEEAWGLAHDLGGRPSLADGQPDWAGTAADLRAWSQQPPPQFALFLGIAWGLAGQPALAFSELQTLDPAGLTDDDERALWHGAHAALFALRGWNKLASIDAERCAACLDPQSAIDGHIIVALFHGFRAYDAYRKQDLTAMDAALAQSLRAWPDNPLGIFLTGERLAADGQWEKAAESLETIATNSDEAWIARHIAARARELRDGKGSSKKLFTDDRMIIGLALRIALREARNTPAGQRLKPLLDAADSFTSRLTDQLPNP